MDTGYPPTQLYIPLAIVFTGLSIAFAIQRQLTADERRKPPMQAIRWLGLAALTASWGHVSSVLLINLVAAYLLYGWPVWSNFLFHFIVLALIGVFALGLLSTFSAPEETPAVNETGNILNP